jgi:hypothetical protein
LAGRRGRRASSLCKKLKYGVRYDHNSESDSEQNDEGGIVAIAHFTMKSTMLKNGMSMSTTVTLEGTDALIGDSAFLGCGAKDARGNISSNFTHCSWPSG